VAVEATRAESIGSAALWFGVLGGPAAWGLQLLVASELVELSCSPGGGGGEVFGVAVDAIIVVLTVVCLVVATAAGVLSFRCLRRIGTGDPSPGQRARWMAVAGLLTSVLSFVVVLQGAFPTVFLSLCERAL
jgi:hypothetical protein